MKSSVKLLFILTLSAVMLTSCGSDGFVGTNMKFFAMDTILDIGANCELPSNASKIIRSMTDGLENKLSVTIETSETASFNRAANALEVSDETADIVRLALKVSALTGGAFDITVCPLVRLWSISRPGDGWKPPGDAQISSLLGSVGYEKLGISQKDGKSYLMKSDPSVEIDLGGVGKGWAVGVLAGYMSECIRESNSYGTLSFGGNVAVYGIKPGGSDFTIGMKNPFDPQTLIGTLFIPSGIIAVSGGYERYVDYGGVRYHHILDPSDGNPSDSDLASAAVWVDAVTPEAGALSDALSTALFVMGSEKSLELLESGKLTDEFGYNFGAVLVKTDGEIMTTENLSDRFTTQ